jgi:hypothetical protein
VLFIGKKKGKQELDQGVVQIVASSQHIVRTGRLRYVGTTLKSYCNPKPRTQGLFQYFDT